MTTAAANNVAPALSDQEEESKGVPSSTTQNADAHDDEKYLFRLSIVKNSFKASDIAFEIDFQLEPIKIIYEVAVISKVAKFFKGKDTDDFR